MGRTLVSWARPLSGALVTLLGLTLTASPAVAAESRAAAAARPTLAAAARARVAAMKVPPRALAQVAGPDAPKSDGRGFFKTPAGAAAIVLMTAGTGYMIYSAFKDNDPVHSPLR